MVGRSYAKPPIELPTTVLLADVVVFGCSGAETVERASDSFFRFAEPPDLAGALGRR
jgi:hypothetical protein